MTSKLDCKKQKIKRRLIDTFNGKTKPREWKPSAKCSGGRAKKSNWIEIALSKPTNIHV